MNRARVKIIVFPAGIDLRQLENYDENVYGKAFSTLNEINVNSVKGGYTILYTADLFEQLDTMLFADNVIQMLTDALPKTMIDIDINYLYIGQFSEECGIAIMKLDDYLTELEHPFVEYNESPSVEHLIDSWDDDAQEFDLSVCDDCQSSPCICDDDDDDDDDDGPCEVCGQPFCMCDDDDDDDDDDYNPLDAFLMEAEGKMKKKNYGRSRVAKQSTKMKKSIKRHNIIISNDKDARKRDERIIRAFLKDFIPGKQKWIKRYREEVLERWVAMYVMSKKQAKKRSKWHKEQQRAKGGKKKITKETAMEFTRSLLHTDLWGDVSK